MRYAFEKARIGTPFGNNHKDCPGFAFTFVQDRSKAAGCFDRPDQARHFKVGWKPRNYAASFSMELTSSP